MDSLAIWQSDESRDQIKIYSAHQIERIWQYRSYKDWEARAHQPYGRKMGPPELPKGAKRARLWMESDAHGHPGTKRPISEDKGRTSIRTLTISKWMACGSKTSAKAWTARESLNCQSMLANLPSKVTDRGNSKLRRRLYRYAECVIARVLRIRRVLSPHPGKRKRRESASNPLDR